jgi:hypothetical protein
MDGMYTSFLKPHRYIGVSAEKGNFGIKQILGFLAESPLRCTATGYVGIPGAQRVAKFLENELPSKFFQDEKYTGPIYKNMIILLKILESKGAIFEKGGMIDTELKRYIKPSDSAAIMKLELSFVTQINGR